MQRPPKRDWRDYFIMATVMGGLGYGLYWTAKRYITPLIAPPTPPQIEQDKASIDASFDKAFALLDQLATDTQELKDAEKTRTERLDKALSEVESVIGKMREANEQRETESRRMAREMTEIRDQIPKAIEKEREGTDARLKDLGAEMKSLKTLVANRMAGGAPRATPSAVSNQAPTPAPATPAVRASAARGGPPAGGCREARAGGARARMVAGWRARGQGPGEEAPVSTPAPSAPCGSRAAPPRPACAARPG